jgi:hypothetical protein
MKNSWYRKYIVFGIIILFVGASVVPSITGLIEKTSNQLTKPANFPLTNNYTNAYWKFDEGSGNIAHDSSGHGYDGTIYGATWVPCGSGYALDFDGIDDYVDLDNHSQDLGFNKTDDLIFSFWFKSSQNTLGRIYSSSSANGYVPEIQIFLAPNGSIAFMMMKPNCGFTLYTDSSYNDYTLHYVEIWYNGITSEPTATIYVDNESEGSITTWVCPTYNWEFFVTKIGRRCNDSTGYFDGIIDEFKIIKYPGGNEQNPPNITGPTNGSIGVNYDFTIVADDPEGDDLWYYVDWGDGTNTDWFGPYPSGQPVAIKHTWYENGTYDIKVRCRDNWHYSSWGHHIIVIGNIPNIPPYAPTITGPLSGDPGVEYEYKFKAIDYDADNVYYYVDWGDGTNTGWFGFYNSGEEVAKTHMWNSVGDYEIKAKAKDIYGNEGDWSSLWIRIGDQPPSAPSISGSTHGKTGVLYNYTVVAIDPEEDNVSYFIDWGDETYTNWSAWNDSGLVLTFSHTWVKKGTYTIEAKAKDIFNKTGDWGTLKVVVPIIQISQSTSQSNPSPNPKSSQQSYSSLLLKTFYRLLNLR